MQTDLLQRDELRYYRDLLQNRRLLFCAVFVTILCYGFAITHYSIGVDDVASNYYFDSDGSGSMLNQGRLLHLLLNSLTHAIDWIPFFTEFVGASLYCLSALLFCGLFQTICDGQLSTPSLAAFTAVYLSASMNVEKFLFHLDVIATMTSYCCCALGLFFAWRFAVRGERKAVLPAFLLTMGAVASYESFLFLYVCGVFAILILEILKAPERWNFSALLKCGLLFALLLAAAAALYYGIVAVAQHLAGCAGGFSRETVWKYSEKGFVGTFGDILREIAVYFCDSLRGFNRSIWIFCGAGATGGLLIFWLAVRKKNGWLILCALGLLLSNFGIPLVIGSVRLRTTQTVCLYLGFLAMLGAAWCNQRKVLKILAGVCISLLVFVQSADMNQAFYNDYVRYQKETFVLNTLATRLLDGYDLSKPVVFTNCPQHWIPEDGYLTTRVYDGCDVNGNSVIYWCGNCVTEYSPTFASELFRLHGYEFVLSPTFEQARQAQTLAQGMPAWPQEGCIREIEDVIAVNFG